MIGWPCLNDQYGISLGDAQERNIDTKQKTARKSRRLIKNNIDTLTIRQL